MTHIGSAWFEIPATDMDRAVAFYNNIFEITLEKKEYGPHQIAVFPYATSVGGGCLMQGKGYTPTVSGVTVYLTTGSDLAGPLSRVAGAGGSVAVPKTPVGPDMGFYAQFLDTEGNRVGLYSKE